MSVFCFQKPRTTNHGSRIRTNSMLKHPISDASADQIPEETLYYSSVEKWNRDHYHGDGTEDKDPWYAEIKRRMQFKQAKPYDKEDQKHPMPFGPQIRGSHKDISMESGDGSENYPHLKSGHRPFPPDKLRLSHSISAETDNFPSSFGHGILGSTDQNERFYESSDTSRKTSSAIYPIKANQEMLSRYPHRFQISKASPSYSQPSGKFHTSGCPEWVGLASSGPFQGIKDLDEHKYADSHEYFKCKSCLCGVWMPLSGTGTYNYKASPKTVFVAPDRRTSIGKYLNADASTPRQIETTSVIQAPTSPHSSPARSAQPLPRADFRTSGLTERHRKTRHPRDTRRRTTITAPRRKRTKVSSIPSQRKKAAHVSETLPSRTHKQDHSRSSSSAAEARTSNRYRKRAKIVHGATTLPPEKDRVKGNHTSRFTVASTTASPIATKKPTSDKGRRERRKKGSVRNRPISRLTTTNVPSQKPSSESVDVPRRQNITRYKITRFRTRSFSRASGIELMDEKSSATQRAASTSDVRGARKSTRSPQIGKKLASRNRQNTHKNTASSLSVTTLVDNDRKHGKVKTRPTKRVRPVTLHSKRLGTKPGLLAESREDHILRNGSQGLSQPRSKRLSVSNLKTKTKDLALQGGEKASPHASNSSILTSLSRVRLPVMARHPKAARTSGIREVNSSRRHIRVSSGADARNATVRERNAPIGKQEIVRKLSHLPLAAKQPTTGSKKSVQKVVETKKQQAGPSSSIVRANAKNVPDLIEELKKRIRTTPKPMRMMTTLTLPNRKAGRKRGSTTRPPGGPLLSKLGATQAPSIPASSETKFRKWIAYTPTLPPLSTLNITRKHHTVYAARQNEDTNSDSRASRRKATTTPHSNQKSPYTTHRTPRKTPKIYDTSATLKLRPIHLSENVNKHGKGIQRPRLTQSAKVRPQNFSSENPMKMAHGVNVQSTKSGTATTLVRQKPLNDSSQNSQETKTTRSPNRAGKLREQISMMAKNNPKNTTKEYPYPDRTSSTTTIRPLTSRASWETQRRGVMTKNKTRRISNSTSGQTSQLKAIPPVSSKPNPDGSSQIGQETGQIESVAKLYKPWSSLTFLQLPNASNGVQKQKKSFETTKRPTPSDPPAEEPGTKEMARASERQKHITLQHRNGKRSSSSDTKPSILSTFPNATKSSVEIADRNTTSGLNASLQLRFFSATPSRQQKKRQSPTGIRNIALSLLPPKVSNSSKTGLKGVIARLLMKSKTTLLPKIAASETLEPPLRNPRTQTQTQSRLKATAATSPKPINVNPRVQRTSNTTPHPNHDGILTMERLQSSASTFKRQKASRDTKHHNFNTKTVRSSHRVEPVASDTSRNLLPWVQQMNRVTTTSAVPPTTTKSPLYSRDWGLQSSAMNRAKLPLSKAYFGGLSRDQHLTVLNDIQTSLKQYRQRSATNLGTAPKPYVMPTSITPKVSIVPTGDGEVPTSTTMSQGEDDAHLRNQTQYLIRQLRLAMGRVQPQVEGTSRSAHHDPTVTLEGKHSSLYQRKAISNLLRSRAAFSTLSPPARSQATAQVKPTTPQTPTTQVLRVSSIHRSRLIELPPVRTTSQAPETTTAKPTSTARSSRPRATKLSRDVIANLLESLKVARRKRRKPADDESLVGLSIRSSRKLVDKPSYEMAQYYLGTGADTAIPSGGADEKFHLGDIISSYPTNSMTKAERAEVLRQLLTLSDQTSSLTEGSSESQPGNSQTLPSATPSSTIQHKALPSKIRVSPFDAVPGPSIPRHGALGTNRELTSTHLRSVNLGSQEITADQLSSLYSQDPGVSSARPQFSTNYLRPHGYLPSAPPGYRHPLYGPALRPRLRPYFLARRGGLLGRVMRGFGRMFRGGRPPPPFVVRGYPPASFRSTQGGSRGSAATASSEEGAEEKGDTAGQASTKKETTSSGGLSSSDQKLRAQQARFHPQRPYVPPFLRAGPSPLYAQRRPVLFG